MLIHNPTTRQKSCTHCVKAKRRCDLVLPKCGRCINKGIDCLYISSKEKKTSKGNSKKRDISRKSATPIPTPTPKTTRPEPGPEPLSELEEVIQNPNTVNEIQQLTESTNITQHQTPINITWPQSLNPSLTTNTCPYTAYLFTTPTPYTSASLPLISQSPMTATQLTYLSTQIHGTIPSLIASNRTFFIHPTSYTTTTSTTTTDINTTDKSTTDTSTTNTNQSTPPELYQDILTTCALYTQKTPQNQTTVFKILDCKVEALKKRAENISVWDIEDMLLVLQVLVMYQIIRIFDGDKTQRLKALLDFKVLGNLTGRLQRSYSEAELTFFLRTPYQQWVLLESIRRTIMMSVLLRGTWCAIENGYCDLVPLLNVLPVTFDGRLWGLEEAAWEKVMCEMKTMGLGLGTYLDFVESWNQGTIGGGRVEDYEMMLLVGCRHSIAVSH